MGGFNLQQMQKMGEALATSEEDNDVSNLDMKCIHCTHRERVTDFRRLAKGNHIDLNGEKGRFNVGKKQVDFYTHHAIVKEVKLTSKFEAELHLIEFTAAPYDSNRKIRRTKTLKTLKNEDIHIIRYAHKTHDPDEIVRRAESHIEICHKTNHNYNVLTWNCEHFCHWCCIGKRDSYQVKNKIEVFMDILTEFGLSLPGRILRVFLRSVDAICGISEEIVLHLPSGLLCAAVLLYFIYCLHSFMKLNTEQKNGEVCSSCYSQLKCDIWLRFAKYAVSQVGGLFLTNILMKAVASNTLMYAVLCLMSIFSIGCIRVVSYFRKTLRSPFKGQMVIVTTWHDVLPADIITFRYRGLMQDALVTSALPDEQDAMKGKITVVHYSNSNGIWEIIEEDLDLDLRTLPVLSHVYDPGSVNVHEPENVIERARKRIGEKKFKYLSNRSCHFCNWAKVNVGELLCTVSEPIQFLYKRELDRFESCSRLQSLDVDHRPNRKHATKSQETTWAKIRDDIEIGQSIQFKFNCFWHKAVVTEVAYDAYTPSKLSVTVVHHGRKWDVREDTLEFDLNKEDIWIYKNLSVYMYSKDDVVRRARAKIGEMNYNPFDYNSTFLCNEIAEKSKDILLLDFRHIHKGDALIFQYCFSKHSAIVTDVPKNESTDNRSGLVKIIHMKRQGILEETLTIDLQLNHVYKKSFDGCICYPTPQIVKRARSRLGETRYSLFGNTSCHFVHWATVVQTPIIVQEVTHRQLEASPHQHPQEVQERLLIPYVTNAYGKFQIMDVYAWCDLSPGDIVEFNYYRIPHHGILSEIDPLRNEIKVMHYGASHLFATRTIMVDTFTYNLKRDKLVVYRTDPRECYEKGTIVERAKHRVGEQDWRRWNRSWDFCLSCVFKTDDNSEYLNNFQEIC